MILPILMSSKADGIDFAPVEKEGKHAVRVGHGRLIRIDARYKLPDAIDPFQARNPGREFSMILVDAGELYLPSLLSKITSIFAHQSRVDTYTTILMTTTHEMPSTGRRLGPAECH